MPLQGDPNLSVAVLEDDPAVRFAVTFFCEGLGMRDVAGATGRELAGMIATRGIQPEPIIADYRLGARTGVEELADVIGTVPTTTKMTVATGDTSPDARDRIGACGWHRLIKPYRPDDLVAVISALSTRSDGILAGHRLAGDRREG